MTKAQNQWLVDADDVAKHRAAVAAEAATMVNICKPSTGKTDMAAFDESAKRMRKLSAQLVSKLEAFEKRWTPDGKRIEKEQTSCK